MTKDEFVHFTCEGCDKKFKKRKGPGRPPTRCSKCRGPQTKTLMCIECDDTFEHPAVRGNLPVRCPACRNGTKEIAFEAVDKKPGEWIGSDGTIIHKVDPRGKVLYAVRLPGSKRPEWLEDLADAKQFAIDVKKRKVRRVNGRVPGQPA